MWFYERQPVPKCWDWNKYQGINFFHSQKTCSICFYVNVHVDQFSVAITLPTPPCRSQTVKKKQKKSSTSSSQHLQIHHRNQVGNALSFDYLKVVRFFHFSGQYDRWEIRLGVLGRFIKMHDDGRGEAGRVMATEN